MTLAVASAVWPPKVGWPDGPPRPDISPPRAIEATPAGPIGRITAVLRRLAALHAELAQALGELAEQTANALPVHDEPSLMSDVDASAAAPANSRLANLGRLLSVADVAERVAVSTDTVRRWRRNKVLPPAIEVAGIVRWRVEVIEKWIAEREKASP